MGQTRTVPNKSVFKHKRTTTIERPPALTLISTTPPKPQGHIGLVIPVTLAGKRAWAEVDPGSDVTLVDVKLKEDLQNIKTTSFF